MGIAKAADLAVQPTICNLEEGRMTQSVKKGLRMVTSAPFLVQGYGFPSLCLGNQLLETMKRMVLITTTFLIATSASAQYHKIPVIVDDVPSIFTLAPIPYLEFADQGNRMYINNSQFYNKDNVLRSRGIPPSNGMYVTPGNSNPINREMYQGVPAPSGTIYSGHVPVREYGSSLRR